MDIETISQLELDIAALASGPPSVAVGEELLRRVAVHFFESQGYAVASSSRESMSACDLVARKFGGESIGVFLTAPIHRLGIADIAQLMGRAQRSEHGQHVLITNGELRPEAVPVVHEAVALSISVIMVDDLRQWLETTRRGNASENTRLHEVVARLSYDLVRLIADDPRTLDQVEWRDLERATACAFRACGFNVTLTRPAKDGGQDLIVQYLDGGILHTCLVEIKHWVSGKRVGAQQVRKFVDVLVREKPASGLLLSTSGFSGNAFEALSHSEPQLNSEPLALRAGGRQKVVTLCKTAMRAESGLWLPWRGLTQRLEEDTESVVVLG